jgi:hypothetical protein
MLRSLAYLAFNSIPIIRTIIEVRETLATSSPLDGASPREFRPRYVRALASQAAAGGGDSA